MKGELKTLKDIYLENFYSEELEFDILLKLIYEMKIEAIKWIKLLDIADEKDREEIEKVANYGALSFPCEIEAQIRWIKYFFNITKEDLK